MVLFLRGYDPFCLSKLSVSDSAIGLYVNAASIFNWARFWRQLGGNFHIDLQLNSCLVLPFICITLLPRLEQATEKARLLSTMI